MTEPEAQKNRSFPPTVLYNVLPTTQDIRLPKLPTHPPVKLYTERTGSEPTGLTIARVCAPTSIR